jgi:PAS domain S-box-containing protein
MKGLGSSSIRTRLLLAFVGVLVPYLALAGLGVVAFRIVWQRVGTIQKEAVVEMKGAADLQVSVLQLVMPANDYLITGDPAERGEFERRLARAREVLARLEQVHLGHPEERRVLAEVRARLSGMEAASREILAVADPRRDSSLVGKMKALDEAGNEVAAALDRFREASEREIEEGIERAVALVWRVSVVGLVLFVLSVGGGVGLAVFFAVWLNRPIQAIARGSRRMADGDLSQRVATDVGGELGDAARAFNEMAERLQERNRQIATLHVAARSLATEHDPARLFQQIVDTARDLIGARQAALAVLQDDGRIRQLFTAGLTPETPPLPVLPAELGPLEEMLRDGSTGPPSARNFISAPIHFREEVLGALYLSGKPGGFTADDDSLVTTLCADAAVTLKNAILYDEVEAQRTRLAQVFDSTFDAIVSADGRGNIVAWNRGAERIFGYREGEVLGRPLATLMPERYREAHRTGLARASATGETRIIGRTVEFPGLHKDGTEFPLELSLSRWTAREETFYSGIIRDVTERKQVEQMKSDFVSFVTHQLRTPLAGIKWMLELVGQSPHVPEEPASYVQDAREAAERLIGLVNDLLDVSRLESGRLKITPGPVNLGELTRSVLDDLVTLVREKGHRLSMEGADRVPTVTADPQLLRQVILNLTSNAIKYTPPGGDVAIRMEVANGAVRWAIRDSGIGIPKESRARLFEKFFRADNVHTISTEGTGLGLYLVRLILEKFSGEVWCESEEGKGATFIFTLPLSEGGR